MSIDMGNTGPGATLREIGVKYLFTENEDRSWKIPMLYKELRQLCGDCHMLVGGYDRLEVFDEELRFMLDENMPEHYEFTDDGNTWHTWSSFVTHVDNYDDSDDESDDDSDDARCDDESDDDESIDGSAHSPIILDSLQ
jgi:hypothetical protein